MPEPVREAARGAKETLEVDTLMGGERGDASQAVGIKGAKNAPTMYTSKVFVHSSQVNGLGNSCKLKFM